MKILINYIDKSNPKNVWKDTIDYHLLLVEGRICDTLAVSYANHHDLKIYFTGFHFFLTNNTEDRKICVTDNYYFTFLHIHFLDHLQEYLKRRLFLAYNSSNATMERSPMVMINIQVYDSSIGGGMTPLIYCLNIGGWRATNIYRQNVLEIKENNVIYNHKWKTGYVIQYSYQDVTFETIRLTLKYATHTNAISQYNNNEF
ncbi:hypothetical protein RF11_09211 [Thelohanellus kitauei]|uniref:Uncharacterized protein n=1 Tax=Thelohanellus kitauei TaxID=669202 RepID=A0A0C2J080_THEKT|nr:hypothetical protein RF11_09211 [Thelohanellus kitauei]